MAANPAATTRKVELKLEAADVSPIIITVEQSALQVSKLHGQRGSEITLSGHAFSAATQIKIGEVAVTELTRNGNSLTFKIPATATGGTLSVTDGSFSWNSPEAFEVTNIWLKVADLDIAQRTYATGFVLGDKLYFGLGNNSTGLKNDFYEVDLKTWAVTPMPSYPLTVGVAGATSTTSNGKGYVIAGYSSSQVKNVYAFNPATASKWEAVTDYPSNGFESGIAFTLNNKIVTGLGYLSTPVINNDRNSNFLYTLDPTGSTGTWSLTPLYLNNDQTLPGLWLATATSDNQVAYIGMGWKNLDGGANIKAFWKYTQTGGWSAMADFPYIGDGMLSGIINGKLMVGAGIGASMSYKTNYYQYNSTTNTWTPLPDGPARYEGISFVYNNQFYVLSGRNDNGYSKEVWKYIPIRD